MMSLDRRLAGLSGVKRDLLAAMLAAKRRAAQQAASALLATQRMSVAAMAAEARLPPAIDPQRAAPAASGAPAHVLLTGATGFIGAFLLDALLARTGATIHCLVRAGSPAEGRARLDANRHGHGLPAPADRVRIWCGDLARPGLGMTPAEYDELADTIGVIHHAGAAVKWTMPYRALAPANVDGTAEILRLACTRRCKPVHFVSTVGVFSSPDFAASRVDEDMPLAASGPLDVGYAQTKWVAEQLVRHAAARGLPVGIYRPNTAPDSRSGAFNRHDHVSLMLQGCLTLGVAPDLDFVVAGAPVDQVAKAQVELAPRAPAATTFHLVAPQGLPWRRLVALAQRRGHALDVLPLAEWLDKVRRAPALDGAFAAFAPLLTEGLIGRLSLPVFDSRNLGQVLGASAPSLHVDETMWNRGLARFEQTGFLPPNHTSRLQLPHSSTMVE